jgi:hypothetical protein
MTFSVPCDCGNAFDVTATQADTSVTCSCGRVVRVPLLSKLRQMAGQGEFETNTIDTINRMLRNGELPSGDRCAISGNPTKDEYDLYVQCESQWLKAANHWKGRLIG